MNQKGFTLIELLVVVAIIGVLAAVGVVSFSGFIENAKDSKCTQQHKTVSNHVLTSIQRCSLNPNGTFPTGPDDNLPCSNLSSQENTQFLVLWTQSNKMMNAYKKSTIILENDQTNCQLFEPTCIYRISTIRTRLKRI